MSEPPARPPLDADRLAAAGPAVLPGVPSGARIEVLAEAPSTNALVAERARAGDAEGLVVVAEHQTAGRGRLDRTWEAPARSGLTFSLLLRPTAPVASWPWLPLLTGCAVSTALRAHGFDAAVKWPNDVLLEPSGEGRKVAGILVERVESTAGPAAVVGIGVNVGMTAAELPVPAATSLAESVAGSGLGVVPDRTELLLDVLASVGEAYAAWQDGGEPAAARLAEAYAAACATVGRRVRVQLPSGATLTGTATGIDRSGRLVVEHHGATTPVSAGDVMHVRAAE
jgi:BirA family biotin operon repressor/biotin-[acetyl-CoA-carboxylase] ligase